MSQPGGDLIRLQLTTIFDHDWSASLAITRSSLFHSSHNIHTIADLAKNYVFAIEPRSLLRADEELRSIGVGSCVGHRQDSRSSMLQREVLIGKLVSVNAFATSAIASGEITTLTHELLDDSVEFGALVSESLLASAKSSEVFHSLGAHVISQLHHNSASISASNRNVEITVNNHCYVNTRV